MHKSSSFSPRGPSKDRWDDERNREAEREKEREKEREREKEQRRTLLRLRERDQRSSRPDEQAVNDKWQSPPVKEGQDSVSAEKDKEVLGTKIKQEDPLSEPDRGSQWDAPLSPTMPALSSVIVASSVSSSISRLPNGTDSRTSTPKKVLTPAFVFVHISEMTSLFSRRWPSVFPHCKSHIFQSMMME